MEFRKTIALCLSGIDDEYHGKLTQGIKEECERQSINVFCFASLMRRPPCSAEDPIDEYIVSGEKSIFSLIPYETIDGIICLGDTFLTDEFLDDIVEKAKEYHVPVVSIDHEHADCYNVVLNDNSGMDLVVEHMVSVHGLSKINFITGFKGNRQSEDRLDAYKRVLKAHNIPIENERIGYGEFGGATERVLNSFFASSLPYPEAIICANDTMAIQTIGYLTNMGLRVPEDVVVSGFDGLKEGQEFEPELTSVRRGLSESGNEAVNILNKLWQGIDVETTVVVEAVPIFSQSCGCKAIQETKTFQCYLTQTNRINKFLEFNHGIIKLNTEIAKANKIEDICGLMKQYVYIFGFKSMFFCLCDDVSIDIENLEDVIHVKPHFEYTQYVTLASTFGNDNKYEGDKFESSKLLPFLNYNGETPFFIAFSPVYFQNISLGYMAISPGKIRGLSDLYYTWLMNITNELGSMLLKNKLENIVGKLEKLYIRDPLTGLYNRRGLNRYSTELFNSAIANKIPVMVLCADLDRLKHINDNYGHQHGDNAIIQVANALNSVGMNSICARYGGDEYCMIISGVEQSDALGVVESIHRYLELYNSASNYEYTVDCSCGYVIRNSDMLDLDELMSIADEKMYIEKNRKKRDAILNEQRGD